VQISAAPAHIEILSYLQCNWSLGATYSNRKDFAFARRVFREIRNIAAFSGHR
jgi:hypothetical protein